MPEARAVKRELAGVRILPRYPKSDTVRLVPPADDCSL